jgi:hypothetical protein
MNVFILIIIIIPMIFLLMIFGLRLRRIWKMIKSHEYKNDINRINVPRIVWCFMIDIIIMIIFIINLLFIVIDFYPYDGWMSLSILFGCAVGLVVFGTYRKILTWRIRA